MSMYYPHKGRRKNKLDLLSEHERELVELKFGLKDGKPKSIKEMAKLLGVSRKSINTALSEAHRKMYGRRIYEKRPEDIDIASLKERGIIDYDEDPPIDEGYYAFFEDTAPDGSILIKEVYITKDGEVQEVNRDEDEDELPDEKAELIEETALNENSKKNTLFKGKIKTMCLMTSPCYFPRPPEYGDELEQYLTITAKGKIKVARKIEADRESGIKPQIVTEKVKISPEEATKILNRIGRYFAKEHEPNIIIDGGGWNLRLTNTEGEVFRFRESTCFDHRSALSRVSKLIREITGLEYILGFDEDTQYGFLLLNKIDKDPADVIEQVKKVARNNDFNVIEYLGEFNGARVYNPIFKKDLLTGMPQFILVKDGKAWLEISEYCLDIIDAFFNDKKEN